MTKANFRRKCLIEHIVPEHPSSMVMEQSPTARTAESWHLKSQAKGREHTGNNMILLKLQSLPLTNTASNNSHLLSLPKQSYQLKAKYFRISASGGYSYSNWHSWGCSLVTEHIPSICEALGSSSSAIKERQKVNWLVSGGFPLNKMEYEDISYNSFCGSRNWLTELHSVG